MTLSRLPLVALLCLTVGFKSYAQEGFVKQYSNHETRLLKRYVANRKVAVRSKGYKFDGKLSTLFLDTTTQSWSDDHSVRVESVDHGPDGVEQATHAVLRTRAGQFWVEDNGGGRFRLVQQKLPTGGDQFANFLSGTAYMLATTYNDATYQHRLGSVLADAVAANRRPDARSIVSVANGDWRGRSVTVLTTRDPFGLNCKTYLDPGNDLAVLGYETDGWYDFKARKTTPVRVVGEVTYSDEKPTPLPMRYESYFVLPDGSRQPSVLMEVTEYRPYTPTADDFDLEKQYGVKPLPPGSTLDAPRRAARSRGLWLYAAAGLFALVTVGLVVYRRRATRRHAGLSSGA